MCVREQRARGQERERKIERGVGDGQCEGERETRPRPVFWVPLSSFRACKISVRIESAHLSIS